MKERLLSKIAQTGTDLGDPLTGVGDYGNPGGDAPEVLNDILTVVIGLMSAIAGIWFFFMLLSGAIQWISSGGDRGKVEAARSRITTGLVGIAIVVASLFVVQIVGGLLGYRDILDPGGLLESGLLSP